MTHINCFGHDEHNVYIVDIESDDLSCKYNPDTRVYLVGTLHLFSGTKVVYKSVDEFIASQHTDYVYVFHNAAFDVPSLRLRGARIDSYYCTMVGSHTLHPESSEYHSLGSLQPQVKRSLRDILIEHGYNFNGVKKGLEYAWYGMCDARLDALVEEYLGLDLEATAREYRRQVNEYTLPTAKKLLHVLMNVNLPYIERIISMEQGIRIEYNDEVSNTLSEATERSMKVCLDTVGYIPNPEVFPRGRVPFKGAGFKSSGDFCKMEMFNPNSDRQVADSLIRLYGWEPKILTKGGAPSVSSEVLESLDYPLCDALLEYSKSTKLQSFCTGLAGVEWLRPSYNQCATRTTRLSSSKP